jgi:hypothetical protein
MTTENDKANAKILLSADEAVVKKIRDVLISNPDIVREAIKQIHLEDDRRAMEMKRLMYQHQAQNEMAKQQAYQQMQNAYPPGSIVDIPTSQSAQGFWGGVFGGKK